MMKKSLQDNTDQYEALLELRNTSLQGTGQSPAKMMFGRATQSFLPAISNTKSERARNATQKRARHRLLVKQSYDKGARDLKQLSPGQPVYYQHTEGKKYDWRRGKVRAKHSERSYIIEGKNGVYRRNRVHIRPTTSEVNKDNSKDNKGEAEVQARPQRARQKPHWTKDYKVC